MDMWYCKSKEFSEIRDWYLLIGLSYRRNRKELLFLKNQLRRKEKVGECLLSFKRFLN